MKSNYSAPGETGRKQMFLSISLEPSTMDGIFQKFPHSEIMPFATTWMDLEMITLSEVSQRKTNTVYRVYVDSKKMIQLNLSTEQKQTHRPMVTRLTVTRGEIGIDMYTMLCLE